MIFAVCFKTTGGGGGGGGVSCKNKKNPAKCGILSCKEIGKYEISLIPFHTVSSDRI